MKGWERTLALALVLAVVSGVGGPVGQAEEVQYPYLEEGYEGGEDAGVLTSEIFGRLLTELEVELARQREADSRLLEELSGGGHTLADPLVALDPYGCAPLCALAIFQTEEPARISVRVPGRSELTDVEFTVEEPRTEHMVPIYGLYADTENEVELTATYADGTQERTTASVRTGQLAVGRSRGRVRAMLYQPEAYSPGLTFSFRNMLAFDAEGEIRWQQKGTYLQTAVFDYAEGTYLSAMGSYLQGEVMVFERNMLGKFLRVLYSPYGIHHDIEPTDRGTLLLTGARGETVEDFVYELSMEDGTVVNTLHLANEAGFDAELLTREPRADWFHLNAITWLGDDILVSGRNISSVLRVGWPEGGVRWILSAPENGWNPEYSEYLLTPEGEGFEWPYFQHLPVVMPDLDDNPDTLDLLLFDNGRNRFSGGVRAEAGGAARPENYSRLVHYRIDERNRTIRQIWQYGKERGEELYAYWRSGVQLSPEGNILGTFSIRKEANGRQVDMAAYVEVDASGELVWEAMAGGQGQDYQEYRGYRRPIYSPADNDLHIGEETVNLVPEDVYQFYGLR